MTIVTTEGITTTSVVTFVSVTLQAHLMEPIQINALVDMRRFLILVIAAFLPWTHAWRMKEELSVQMEKYSNLMKCVMEDVTMIT